MEEGVCVKCGVNEQMKGSQLCKQCSDEGVRVAEPTPQDMEFVRAMRMRSVGKEPIPEEILDLLALFEDELRRSLNTTRMTIMPDKPEDYAIARAWSRYAKGERVE